MSPDWKILPFGQRIGSELAFQMLGFIPSFLDDANPQKAAVQLDANYRHGGGWRPLKGWQLLPDGGIVYPGDPPYQPLAMATLGNEVIYVYQHAWVCIVQQDREFEVSRMD